MAQDSPGGENGQKQQKLSHKQRKALWRKEKRRKKRQEEARAREEELQAEQGTNEAPEKAEESDGERNIQEDEAEREGQHQLWLEREARAQEEFRVRREREEMKKRELEEQERLIREEWEEQQRKEKEAKERKEQQKKEQEDKLNKMLDSSSTSGNKKKEEWHNPMAPADYSAGGEVPAPTGRAAEDCPFFQKTGACRFGDRCSRKHTRPDSTTTLLIPGMFATFALDQTQRDDFDETMYLEYGEDELYKDFIEFYNDTLPEFRTLGRVVQFKVCCNHEPHLRGNVYVQYERAEDCLEAIRKFHGRFYAGKQLTCEMTPVTSWKSAICGLFSRKRCPKGKHCNFLHVFPNPGREFRDADEDHHLGRGQHDSRRSWREFSKRRGSVRARSWRHSSERLRSHSPSHRSQRSLRRESRSRSRERSRRMSRVRSRSKSRSRRRKRSRSRSRERSSRREQDRSSRRSDRDSSIGQSTGNENEKDQKDIKNEDSDSGQESSNTDDHMPDEKLADGQNEMETSTGSCLNPDDGKDTVTGQQEEVMLTRSPRKSKSPSVKQWSRSRSRSKSKSPHTSSHHKHKRSHSHRRHRKKKKKRRRRKRAEDEEDSRDKSSSGSGSEQEEVDSCDAVLDSVSTQET